MKLIKRFLQGGTTSNVLLKGLTGLTLQAGLQLAKLASEILSTNSPQKNDFVKNEQFIDPSSPINYLTPAMQKGDKIPSSNGISLMTFFKHMIPGFREAYKMKLDQKKYDEIQRLKYRVRIPLQDYPILLPKLLSNNLKTLTAKHQEGGEVNLSKLPTAPKAEERYANSRRMYPDNKYFDYSMTYGKSGKTTGVVQNTPYSIIPAMITQQVIGNDTIWREHPSLPRFQKTFFRPMLINRKVTNKDADAPIMRRRFNTAWNIAKDLEGGELQRRFWKLSPATPVNRLSPNSNAIQSMPEVKVNGIDRRWRFDRRSMDLGNNRGITSEVFYDYYDGGNTYLGDYAKVKGGRTIYSSPKGNDTIYFNTPTMEDGWYKHVGNMVVGSPLPGAKANFFKNLKRPLVKHQTGGLVERTDNTSVASRPLLIKNEIPYGAGKGPAGEGPMRLFNDPYVGIGMMAMAPLASRGFSSTKPASVNKFSTYIKGLPKSMSTSDKVAIGAGTVGGIALGYDDDHSLYVREGMRKVGLEFPLGINPKGDSIYNNKHAWDEVIKYLSNRSWSY